ncbi:MAG: hypothetical protein IJ466_00365 [Clostridia bacterium]|nr:hypothetical protein [Clostridia bacterium]
MSTLQDNYTLEAELTTGVIAGASLPEGGEAGQVLVKTESGAAWQDAAVGYASAEKAGVVRVGANLRMENGVLSVDTAASVEQDNTRPVTSAAVHTQLGNVEALLKNI